MASSVGVVISLVISSFGFARAPFLFRLGIVFGCAGSAMQAPSAVVFTLMLQLSAIGGALVSRFRVRGFWHSRSLSMLHKVKTYYIPNVLVKMRMGGQSNRSLKNRIKANLQDRKAWSVNNIRVPLYTLILKPLLKIGQYRFLF